MKASTKHKIMSVVMAFVAIFVGAAIILLGDKLLNVDLELFHGISTFSPVWVLDLFVVPFIAGIFVSVVYGLGGKILAYFAPLAVRITSYITLGDPTLLPEGTTLLPIGFWILILVVAVEFAALGGIVGEVIVKKTYGRSDKHTLHKKYQKPGEVGN